MNTPQIGEIVAITYFSPEGSELIAKGRVESLRQTLYPKESYIAVKNEYGQIIEIPSKNMGSCIRGELANGISSYTYRDFSKGKKKPIFISEVRTIDPLVSSQRKIK